MTEDLMTIRQMCETFDVTARTLRFYESKELLAPIREGQKRLFTKKDRARLTLILRGKKIRFFARRNSPTAGNVSHARPARNAAKNDV